MTFENGVLNEPINDRSENIQRFRALARQLEKMTPIERDEVFRWLEQYKKDVQKNPAVLLEATEIVMDMISESRRQKLDSQKEEKEQSARRQESIHPHSDVDPTLLDQRWKEFQLAMQYEGLEMAHEDMTDQGLSDNKKDMDEWSHRQSHGKRGRK
jgi:hypothetical protein